MSQESVLRVHQQDFNTYQRFLKLLTYLAQSIYDLQVTLPSIALFFLSDNLSPSSNIANSLLLQPCCCAWFLNEDKTFYFILEANSFCQIFHFGLRSCMLRITPAFARISFTRRESIGCKMQAFCAKKKTRKFCNRLVISLKRNKI